MSSPGAIRTAVPGSAAAGAVVPGRLGSGGSRHRAANHPGLHSGNTFSLIGNEQAVIETGNE